MKAPDAVLWEMSEPEPQPLLTLTYEELADHNSDGFRLFKAAASRDVVVKAFGPGGGGHTEIRENLERERAAIAREHAERENQNA